MIVPCYNEQEVIDACHQKISAAIEPLTSQYGFEIIYIMDDGSTDQTIEHLYAIKNKGPPCHDHQPVAQFWQGSSHDCGA